MSQVIVFPRGQLTPKDKERLTKAGFVAVEADDPSAVVCVLPGPAMASADDMLMAALGAVNNYGSSGCSADFLKRLMVRMNKREEERAAIDKARATPYGEQT